MSFVEGVDVRRGLNTFGLSVAIVVAASLVAIYSVRDGGMGLIIAAALLVASIVFVDGGRSDFFVNQRWIPYAWIALCLTPDVRFGSRNPLDTSVSTASLETFVQVIMYALVAGLVIHDRRAWVARDPRHIQKGPVLAWPLIALLSTVWSLVPLFTLVRALQLLVPIGLTILMARIWVSSPARAAAIWRDTLRLFVRTVTILVLLGFATGFSQEARFAWPGILSVGAALYMGVALLVLAACGSSFLGMRRSGYAFRMLLFAVGLYLSQTRTVIAALLVAVAVLFWWTGRTKPLTKVLGLFYYAVATVFVVAAALPQILQYLARGETTQGFWSLNGRIPLWGVSIDLVSDGARWLTGFGYGAARVILPTHVDWAGTAHNSWVELLLAIGILGPLLALADIVYLFRHAASRRSVAPPELVLTLLAFWVVVSIASETLALPGIGFVILMLLHAPVLAQRSALDRRRAMRNARFDQVLEPSVRPVVARHL